MKFSFWPQGSKEPRKTPEGISLIKILRSVSSRVVGLMIPQVEAEATYHIIEYRNVQGTTGCDAYGHRYRQVRTCTYNDNGTLVSCTSWAYYACGWN